MPFSLFSVDGNLTLAEQISFCGQENHRKFNILAEMIPKNRYLTRQYWDNWIWLFIVGYYFITLLHVIWNINKFNNLIYNLQDPKLYCALQLLDFVHIFLLQATDIWKNSGKLAVGLSNNFILVLSNCVAGIGVSLLYWRQAFGLGTYIILPFCKISTAIY